MSKDELEARVMTFVISAALFVALAFFALPGILTNTSRWRTVEGTILEFDVSIDEIAVRYAYEVDGRTYNGSKATLWSDRLPRSFLPNPPASTQAVGRRIRVSYDPADPKRAVLDPTVSTSHRVLAIAGTCLTTLGMVVAVLPQARPR